MNVSFKSIISLICLIKEKYNKSNFSGQISLQQEHTPDTTECYLKNLNNSGYDNLDHPDPQFGPLQRGSRNNARIEDDNWLTNDGKNPLQSYVLKTKGEILEWMLGVV